MRVNRHDSLTQKLISTDWLLKASRKIPALALIAFPTHGLKVVLVALPTCPLRIDVVLSHQEQTAHTILMVQIQVRNISFDVIAVAQSTPRTVFDEAIETYTRRSGNMLLQ